MADDKIRSLRPGAPIPGIESSPNPDVVEALEAALKDAKSGQLRGLGMVVLDAHFRFATICVGDRGNLAMLGAIGLLRSRVEKMSELGIEHEEVK